MNCLRLPLAALPVSPEASALLLRRLKARRAWLESQVRIRELKRAERQARIKAAQDRALESWRRELPANVTSLEGRR